jgi:hypothetical protein
MKKIVIIVLIILVIGVGLLLFSNIKPKINDNSGNLNGSLDAGSVIPENPNEPKNKISDNGANNLGNNQNPGTPEGGGSTSTETSQSPGEGTNDEIINETPKLPADLHTAECGYYFRGYGVCAGVCPAGTCTLDERSCYCQ